jgi:hypothetical protein
MNVTTSRGNGDWQPGQARRVRAGLLASVERLARRRCRQNTDRWARRIRRSLSRCQIIREAVCTDAGKTCSLLFRLSLSLASVQFDGRFRWVARRRANIGCPRDRALSWSRSPIPPGGSLAQPKLTESRKHHTRSSAATACLAVSRPSASCSKAPSVATTPQRLGSRPQCYWP